MSTAAVCGATTRTLLALLLFFVLVVAGFTSKVGCELVVVVVAVVMVVVSPVGQTGDLLVRMWV